MSLTGFGSVEESKVDSLNIPVAIQKILSHRGYNSNDQIVNLVAPSFKNLTDPFLMKDMGKVVERLYEALRDQQKICVYADFDLDGTSGAALLVSGLSALGFENVSYYQPKRLSEGYGVHAPAVRKIAELGAQIIMTVDVGITAFEAAKEAKSYKVDFIVTDHHQSKDTLPDAYAIVNPNRKDCSSGLGHLSGVGVGFYTLLGLKKYLLQKGWVVPDFDFKNLLDCLAIGTIGDMCPMIKENRVLVKHGLKKLAQTQRPGLQVLLSHEKLLGREISTNDVAMSIAPKINALSRMEREILPIDVFMAGDLEEAEGVKQAMLENHKIRKEVQNLAYERAKEMHLTSGRRDFIFAADESFHKGVLGLVATRLAQEFNVPAFVGSISKENLIVGSSRLPPESRYSLVEVLGSAKEALLQFGGHIQAAGFTLEKEKALQFQERLGDYFLSNVSTTGRGPSPFDCEVTLGELDQTCLKWLRMLEPYGPQFSYPLFKVFKVKISQLKRLKELHLKMKLRDSNGEIDAIFFNIPNSAKTLQVGEIIDIIGELRESEFAGRKTLQLIIRDVVVSDVREGEHERN